MHRFVLSLSSSLIPSVLFFSPIVPSLERVFPAFRFLFSSRARRKSAEYSRLIRFVYMRRVQCAHLPWQFFLHYSLSLSLYIHLSSFIIIITIIIIVFRGFRPM